MPREKRDYDPGEVTEIIELRIKELNGIISKLSYNGVCNMNKKIANNPEYIQKNGKQFKLYPYDFWAGQYKGEENYGKIQIDKIKESRQTEYLSGIFDQSLQDVLLAVNDLHNNPTKLSSVLINIFKKDKQNIQRLEKENTLLREKNEGLKNTLGTMQQSVYNIFYNSKSAKNSLKDVMELKRSQDGFMSEQITNAFCVQNELIERLLEREDAPITSNDNVLELNRDNRRLRNQKRNL